MKHVIIILLAFIISNSILGQNLISQNSADTDCKFYQGRLPKTVAENASYIYHTSEHSGFIEFSTLTWNNIITKYRLEKLFYNQTFTITKAVINSFDSTSSCFIAIDSNMFNECLKSPNIVIPISLKEPIVLDYFSSFIDVHNLKNEFFGFNPNSFVAWFKIKSKGKIRF